MPKVQEVVERMVIGAETHITFSEFLLNQRRVLSNCRCFLVPLPLKMEGTWAPAMIVDGVMPESEWPLDDPEPNVVVEVSDAR